jgi:hypothetical protein
MQGMKGRWFALIFLVTLATTFGVAMAALRLTPWAPKAGSIALAAQADAVNNFGMNRAFPNVTMVDLQGHRHNLKASRGKVIVLLVQGNKCPCSKAYIGRVNAIQRDYGPKGVEVWAFNPNANETKAETIAFCKENGVEYPVAYDKGAVIADVLKASCTTEAWVADQAGYLRYHGRIDDNIYEPDKVKVRDLRNAIDALLVGGNPPVQETEAYACTIARTENPDEGAGKIVY